MKLSLGALLMAGYDFQGYAFAVMPAAKRAAVIAPDFIPRETWFLARGGKLGGTRAKSASWKWSYHFFRGLAAAYTSAEKLQWSQAVGSTHALYEVVCAALIKAGSTGGLFVRLFAFAAGLVLVIFQAD